MAFLDLFSKKEEPKKTDREQVSEVRSTTQQIAVKLSQVRFTEGGKIDREKMDKYRAAIAALTSEIDRAQILRLDTSEIDRRILYLAEYLPDAIRNGNEETADRILRAVSFGITRARRDIGAKDMERSASIVESRVRRLDMYRDVIELSRKIDDLNASMAQQDKLLEKYKSDYEVCSADLKKNAALRPDLVRQIDELGFGSNQLSAGARGLDTARVRVIQLSDTIENLERQKATNEAALQQNQATIHTLENQMTQADALVDEQTLDHIRKEQAQFQSEMLKLENQIDEMERLNKDFTRSLDAIYSSPDMVDRIIRHAMEYEELERKEAAKEAGIREGLENAAMLEQQENESLLNM